MTHLMLTLACAALALGGLAGLVRQLHMLQQNSYYNTRYLNWLKTAFSARTVCSLIAAAAAAALLWLPAGYGIPALAFAAAWGAVRAGSAVTGQKRAIKPLVFTARVWRMLATAAVLFAVLCAQTLLPVRVTATAVLALSLCTPGMTLLVNLINAPIERAVKGWYIRDAKRILRGRPNLKIIGVTGSYGKTSTKYILRRLLSEKYNVAITPGSFNTTMGVVRTVREHLKPVSEIFLCEMGAKNVGDIKEICDLVHPDLGVITSVGPQHLQTFKTVDNVLRTKFELADAVLEKGGTVFVNAANELIRNHVAETGMSAVRYGLTEDCDCRAQEIRCSRAGTSFTLCAGELRIPIKTRLLGSHSVLNLTAAAAVALRLGVSADQIAFAASQLKPVEHRLELKPFLNGAVLIDDAYNANPEGSLEAVRVLGSFEGMKKIIVTPGLVELDEQEYECNYRLGLEAGKVCDEIILVGEKRAVPMADAVRSLPEFDPKRLHVVGSFREAMELLRGSVDGTCAVLFENDLPDNYAR